MSDMEADLIYAQKPIGAARKTYIRKWTRPTPDKIAALERATRRVVYSVSLNRETGWYEIHTHPVGWRPEFEWREKLPSEIPLHLNG